MHTTNSVSTRGIPLVPSRMATPPPPSLDLFDADTPVGWVDGTTIGFRGFGDETEATHAAWVAYRTMSRRFSRDTGQRPPPIDSAPMSLDRSGDVELIQAGGRPIATLVRPGAGSRSGAESFGFEIEVPVPAAALTMRSTAHLIYRTLRRSGIRWAMWTPAPLPQPSEPSVGNRGPATEDLPRAPSRRDANDAAALSRRETTSSIVSAASIALVMLVAVSLPAITTSTVGPLLGGVAALIALVALASLARLVVTDVRDRFSWRERPTWLTHRTGGRRRVASLAPKPQRARWGRSRTLGTPEGTGRSAS